MEQMGGHPAKRRTLVISMLVRGKGKPDLFDVEIGCPRMDGSWRDVSEFHLQNMEMSDGLQCPGLKAT
jgi:hypothetical protein